MPAILVLDQATLTSDSTNFVANGNIRINGTPTNNNDLVNKSYVDAIVNMASNKIQIYMIDNAVTTTIAAINTPVKALGTTTLLTSPLVLNALNFDMPISNRIRYIGTETVVGINITATLISANNSQNFGGYLYKNGVNIGNGFKQEGSIPTSATSRVGYGAYGFINLVTNDYLEFFIENQTAANPLTVRQLQITVGTI